MSLLALALVLGLHACTPPATAEPTSSLELHWSAPSSCPDRSALLAAIDATIGDVATPELRPITVHGQLDPATPEGFLLRLDLDDDGHTSTRELRGPSCEELTEAAALVIAITIDPRLLERLQEQPEPPELIEPGEVVPTPPAPAEPAQPAETVELAQPAPEPEPKRTPEPAPPDPAPTASSLPEPANDDQPPRRSNPPLQFLTRLHAGLGGGPLPGPTAVLSLAIGLASRLWRTELTATYWTPRTTTSAINPTIGVHTQLWTLGANACLEPIRDSLTFPLCAGLLAGALHAHGTGDLLPNTVSSRWVALTLEPGLTWWLRPRLGLAVRTRAHVTLARPGLISEPSGTVFQGAPVGGALLVGLELRLP